MKKCIIENCNNTNIVAKGLCCKHYKQQYRHGFILKRTIYDKNEFVFDNEVCIIKCFNKNGEVVAKSMIDLEDYEKVKDKKWSYLPIGYICCCSENLFLHRFLMEDKLRLKSDTVDHINRNKLDNRKSNLRILTKQQNLLNKGLQSNNSSGVRGVRIKKLKSSGVSYEARITINGKEKYLGRYKTIEEAEQVRKQAEKELFGEDIIYEE